MKITIEPTGNFQDVNGVRCRMWKGTTERGTTIELFSPLVRSPTKEDQSELEAALQAVKVDQQLVSFDYRLVM